MTSLHIPKNALTSTPPETPALISQKPRSEPPQTSLPSWSNIEPEIRTRVSRITRLVLAAVVIGSSAAVAYKGCEIMPTTSSHQQPTHKSVTFMPENSVFLPLDSQLKRAVLYNDDTVATTEKQQQQQNNNNNNNNNNNDNNNNKNSIENNHGDEPQEVATAADIPPDDDFPKLQSLSNRRRAISGTSSGTATEHSDTPTQHSDDARVFQAWVNVQQHPQTCDTERTYQFTGSNTGADIQAWKNTLLDALIHNKVLASGRYASQLPAQDCPSQNVEECMLNPISNCVAPPREKRGGREEGGDMKGMPETTSTCAVFNARRLSQELGFKQNRSLAWFHAQTMRYLYKPQEHMLQSLGALKAQLGLNDMSQVLTMHVADSYVDDGRRRISTARYAKVARTLIFWHGFDVVLVKAIDTETVETLQRLIERKPINPDVKVIHLPNDIAVPHKENSFSSSEALTDQSEPDDADAIDDDDFDDDGDSQDNNNNKHNQITSTIVPDIFSNQQAISDIFTVLSADQAKEIGGRAVVTSETDSVAHELMAMALMAQSGGFIGTLSCGFGRSVWDLVNSMPPMQRGVLYDMEKRPYFGCPFPVSLPLGGGNVMFPIG